MQVGSISLPKGGIIFSSSLHTKFSLSNFVINNFLGKLFSLKTYLIQREVEMLAKGGDRDSRLAVIRSKIGSVNFQSKFFFAKSIF